MPPISLQKASQVSPKESLLGNFRSSMLVVRPTTVCVDDIDRANSELELKCCTDEANLAKLYSPVTEFSECEWRFA